MASTGLVRFRWFSRDVLFTSLQNTFVAVTAVNARTHWGLRRPRFASATVLTTSV